MDLVGYGLQMSSDILGTFRDIPLLPVSHSGNPDVPSTHGSRICGCNLLPVADGEGVMDGELCPRLLARFNLWISLDYICIKLIVPQTCGSGMTGLVLNQLLL